MRTSRPSRATFGAQSLGRELRPTEDVTAVAAGEPNRALAVSPLRLLINATLLLPADRSVQEYQKDVSAAEPPRSTLVARVFLLLRNEESQLR